MKCPECQVDLPDYALFCLKCGCKISLSTEISSVEPRVEGERKRITALFSDLSGYTAITEKLDPEKVKGITGRIFDEIRTIIEKYEGSIERIAGDGLLALFGVPKAHEDDPIRAIHAAREIHSIVKGISPKYESKIGRPLSMHSGVNTGLAVTSELDPEKGSYGVTGDAVNTAARLSELAHPNEILVGPETYKLLKNLFNFQTLQPAQVKGKSQPISVYKLSPGKPSNSTHQLSRQVSSEMVGRDKELAKLELQVLKAINGEGSVVNVIGEAGIGKSRLIAELKNRDIMKRVMVLEGRAISIGKNLQFHPIIDLLKNWSRISEDDSTSNAFNKLEQAVHAIHPEETNEILPFVATLMGMKLKGRHAERVADIEGEGLEKLIFKNVRELVIKGSELRPTVTIMEDLHWADTTSIELLEALYRLAEKHSLLFINVFRPGYLDEKDQRLSAVGERLPVYHVEIEINPLKKDESQTLIHNMLEIKGLPIPIRNQIVNRAGGNPFFIEEVVRSFIDEGAIIKKDTGFEVTNIIHNIVIPPTINDVLIARIDRLEERTRELVKVASVVGRSFFDRIIKDVADSIDNLDDRLSYLKDAQLIRDRIRMQELEYIFKHALAQEAAYSSTLIEQRKALHLKVAQSTEGLFQERLHEFYGMLSYHYGKGGNVSKAEEYMSKAGEEALRASANSEVLNYFNEALTLYLDRYGEDTDPEKVMSFKKNLALAHLNRGNFSEALIYLDEILKSRGYRLPKSKLGLLFRFVIDLIVITIILYSPINFKTKVPNENDIDDCDLIIKKMFCLADKDSRRFFTDGFSWVRKQLSYNFLGLPQGLKWLSLNASASAFGGLYSFCPRLLKHTETISTNRDRQESIHFAVAHNFFTSYTGSYNAGFELNSSMIEFGLRTGDIYSVIIYLNSLTDLNLEQGNFYDLENILEKYQYVSEKYGHELAHQQHHLVKAELSLRKRKFHIALTEAEMCLNLSGQADFKPRMTKSLGIKTIAESLLALTKEAHQSVKEGEALISTQKNLQSWWLIPFLLGRALLHIQLLDRARDAADQSDLQHYRKLAFKSSKIAVKASKKFAPYRVWILKVMGDYYWTINKQQKALKWYVRSIKEGKSLNARPDLSRTYLEVGKRLLEPQSKYKKLNGIGAKGYLEKAEKLFEEMGLEKDLDELKRFELYA